jgi:hypothetical protein
MMHRLLLVACLTVCSLPAQLQLFLVQNGSEAPVTSEYGFGAISTGDFRDIPFRLRNTGTTATSLTIFSLAGEGFTFINPPQVPQTVAGGAALDFSIHFAPSEAGFFSANFTADGVSVIVHGTARAATSISLDPGNGTPPHVLAPGETIDFGAVRVGSTATRRLVLSNKQTNRITIRNVAVVGAAFQLKTAVLPLNIDPGTSASLEVAFAPAESGTLEGALEIEQRRYPLRGVANGFTKPGIGFDTPSPESGQQIRLTIRFDSASRQTGNGQVQMEFRPSQPGAADSGILFIPTGNQVAPFAVNEGDTVARFGSQNGIDFQTGTTAGEIVFTATLGEYTEHATLTIPRAAIGLDSTRTLRTSAGLDLQINAFDNTRSASKLTFTFFDQGGNALSPGAITVDGAAAFQQYFAPSTVGGVFGLHAFFPVHGNPGQVESVEIQLVNSMGTAKTGRLRFTTP